MPPKKHRKGKLKAHRRMTRKRGYKPKGKGKKHGHAVLTMRRAHELIVYRKSKKAHRRKMRRKKRAKESGKKKSLMLRRLATKK